MADQPTVYFWADDIRKLLEDKEICNLEINWDGEDATAKGLYNNGEKFVKFFVKSCPDPCPGSRGTGSSDL